MTSEIDGPDFTYPRRIVKSDPDTTAVTGIHAS